MPNQNEADPPVRSQDPFRQASDPLSRETAAGDDDLDRVRDASVAVESESYTDSGPDAVGLAEDAAAGQGSGGSGNQADQQAREAGSGTTRHEVEPEANKDMNLLGFDKNRK